MAWQLGSVDGGSAEALELIERAVALAPWQPDFHHTHGVILSRLGRHSDAATAFRRAVAQGAGSAEVALDLARALKAAGQRVQARAVASEGLRILGSSKEQPALLKALEAIIGGT